MLKGQRRQLKRKEGSCGQVVTTWMSQRVTSCAVVDLQEQVESVNSHESLMITKEKLILWAMTKLVIIIPKERMKTGYFIR